MEELTTVEHLGSGGENQQIDVFYCSQFIEGRGGEEEALEVEQAASTAAAY